MRKYIYCDTCKDETEHEVIKEDKNLYRCIECGTFTHHEPEKEIRVRAIISSGEQSEKGSVLLKQHDIIEKGDELIVETNESYKLGEITSIELKDGKRVDSCEANKASTIWLRNVGEVIVKMSLHKRAVTTPYKILVSGDTEFTVGEELEIGDKVFYISRIKLNDGKLLKKFGDVAKAREIKRVYAMFRERRKRSWR
ncbi:hypothetical protein DRO97_09670 [Archaeoglobales archaeon]|nr:MAG: hypothetical protein DRO97_09670 [Archaeoglobales archaeon]